jgi:hypothetical protein
MADSPRARLRHAHGVTVLVEGKVLVGSHPTATFQYSSTTLYQVSDHIQSLFF